MGNQHSSLEVDTTEKKFRDFREIDKNKIIINSLLENVDWVTELYLGCNDIDLPSELFLKKKRKINKFWAPLQKVSNRQKKLLNKPWLSSGILKSIEIKNRLRKRMCGAKDSLNKEELSNKVKNYRNTVLILYQYKILKYLTCKIKIFYTILYKYFHYSKLNIFQT